MINEGLMGFGRLTPFFIFMRSADSFRITSVEPALRNRRVACLNGFIRAGSVEAYHSFELCLGHILSNYKSDLSLLRDALRNIPKSGTADEMWADNKCVHLMKLTSNGY